MKPRNGEKTHPLSQVALEVLRKLLKGPIPASLINPGIRDRLAREQLAELVNLPSPFKTSRGNPYPHGRMSGAVP